MSEYRPVISAVMLLCMAAFAISASAIGLGGIGADSVVGYEKPDAEDIINLPAPNMGTKSLADSIQQRRSRRNFTGESVTLEELAALLHGATGITMSGHRNFRAAPSAGATYPIETMVVVQHAEGLEPGVYIYKVENHELWPVRTGDISAHFARACFGIQDPASVAVAICFVQVPSRIQPRYGGRSQRYTYMEAGHMGQNIYLVSESLGLGCVAVGAFRDSDMDALLGLTGERSCIYVHCIGRLP